MMYASKTPRDLNRDPLPFVTYIGERTHIGTTNNALDPRPEFDHVQHNEPNPILVDYRAHKDDGPAGYVVESGSAGRPFGYRPTRIQHYLFQLSDAERDTVLVEIGLGVKATPDQIIHARRVLTRLSRLSQSETGSA